MDEENLNSPDAINNEEFVEKKKRGRKPKSTVSEQGDFLADADAAASETQKAPKRRGRPPRAKKTDASQANSSDFDADRNAAGSADYTQPRSAENRGESSWQDRRNDAESSSNSENDYDENSEENIFVHHTDGDDFAFNRADKPSSPEPSERDDEDYDYRRPRSNSDSDDSAEVPQYFSTSDEDLNPDSYRDSDDSDKPDVEERPARPQRDAARAEGDDSQDSPQENSQENGRGRWQQNFRNPRRNAREPQPQNQRVERNDNRNQQNQRGEQFNQRGDYRDYRDYRNGGGFQQNRNAQFNQRDNRNNRQQNNRNQPNQQNQRGQQMRANQPNLRNQPNQGRGQNQRNPNQQIRQQNQLNQQKAKANKIQIAGVEEDAMNPSSLPDWQVIKSRAAISKWLAEVFFGVKQEAKTPENAVSENNSPEIIASPENSEQNSEQPQSAQTAQEQSSESEISPVENLVENSDSAGSQASQEISSQAKVEESDTLQAAQKAESEAEVENETEEPFDAAASAVIKIGDGMNIEALTDFDEIYPLSLKEIQAKFDELSVEYKRGSGRSELMEAYIRHAQKQKKLVLVSGVLDVFENDCGGALTYVFDSFKLRRSCVYIPQIFINKYHLQRGCEISVLATAPREGEGENCPIAVKLVSVDGGDPAALTSLTPFTDLTPYYPTRRIIMEAPTCATWDNLSMRAVDLLTPIGCGQRALIVAPPRTGKTVLMQGMAKSIRVNSPDLHLMILLVDERPEEVTDFKRNVDAEVISSTFDEDPHSHVHAAEMVISRARRMVESGKNVVILLDSITRLARAYNALMPNGGRTMSGGVEANALQKPKRFFGSARNIEGGGSLTIIGTALVETGSKMDEVIFEEFKGTGNLELHLDRQLSDKRIFPAINIEKSGTRKEELLYHPDELKKIYTLRRAMKGVPTNEAMEMLLQRLKKVKTNVEFLMGLNS